MLSPMCKSSPTQCVCRDCGSQFMAWLLRALSSHEYEQVSAFWKNKNKREMAREKMVKKITNNWIGQWM